MNFNLHYITFGAVGVLVSLLVYQHYQLGSTQKDLVETREQLAATEVLGEFATKVASGWEQFAVQQREKAAERESDETEAVTVETVRLQVVQESNEQLRELTHEANDNLGECVDAPVYSDTDNLVRRKVIQNTLAGATSRGSAVRPATGDVEAGSSAVRASPEGSDHSGR